MALLNRLRFGAAYQVGIRNMQGKTPERFEDILAVRERLYAEATRDGKTAALYDGYAGGTEIEGRGRILTFVIDDCSRDEALKLGKAIYIQETDTYIPGDLDGQDATLVIKTHQEAKAQHGISSCSIAGGVSEQEEAYLQTIEPIRQVMFEKGSRHPIDFIVKDDGTIARL